MPHHRLIFAALTRHVGYVIIEPIKRSFELPGGVMSPTVMKWLINLWPPYLGAGVQVEKSAVIIVRCRCRCVCAGITAIMSAPILVAPFSMTDPFYMLMLMRILGRDYIVWDKSASIDFVAPGRGKVSGHVRAG